MSIACSKSGQSLSQIILLSSSHCREKNTFPLRVSLVQGTALLVILIKTAKMETKLN